MANAEVQIAKDREVEVTTRTNHAETQVTARTNHAASEVTKRVQAEANASVANAAATQAGHEATRAAEVTKQREHELAIARLQYNRATDRAERTEEDDDEEDDGAVPAGRPQAKKRKTARRPRVSTAAPPLARPRPSVDAMSAVEYTPDHLVQWLRRKYAGENWMGRKDIERRFKEDQENPFVAFVPTDLSLLRTWLYRQLEDLVAKGKLIFWGRYQGAPAYEFAQ